MLLLNNGESQVKTDQLARIKYKTYRILIARDVEYLRCNRIALRQGVMEAVYG